MKRTAMIVGLVVLTLVVSFLAYGWWTRRGPIEFSQGGAFGSATASATPTPTPTGSVGEGSASPSPQPRASIAGKRTEGGTPRARQAGRIAPPTPGTYTYRGTGREDVRFGPASACGWDIDEVTLVTKVDAGSLVMDWIWSGNRQQRGMYTFDERGMFHRFYGAVATCVGVRRTEEGTYSPPPARFRFPLTPGRSWVAETRSSGWHERSEMSVVRAERVTVAAGTFDTFVVTMSTTFSDGQSGSFEATMWFAPALGLWVKERAVTDVRASGADFTSDYTIELAVYPR